MLLRTLGRHGSCRSCARFWTEYVVGRLRVVICSELSSEVFLAGAHAVLVVMELFEILQVRLPQPRFHSKRLARWTSSALTTCSRIWLESSCWWVPDDRQRYTARNKTMRSLLPAV